MRSWRFAGAYARSAGVRMALLCLPALGSAQRPAATEGKPALRVLLIGDLDTRDERSIFTRLADVQVSHDGRIFALDQGEAEVKVFDDAGRFLYKFGRRGSGPGEFGYPSTLEIRDSLVVVPAGAERVATFGLDGKHRRTHLAPLDSLRNPTILLRGGWRLRHIGITPSANVRTPVDRMFQYLLLSRSRTAAVDTLAKIWAFAYFEQRNGMATALPSRFGASGAWALHGDSLLAIVDGYAGSVTWRLAGPAGVPVLRTESLGRAGQAVSDSDIASEMDAKRQSAQGMAGGERIQRTPPIMRILNPPARWSVATEARFSAEGDLFVRLANSPGGERVWRVFPVSGASYDVLVPGLFYLKSIRAGKLYGTEFLTDDRVTVLSVYQIRR